MSLCRSSVPLKSVPVRFARSNLVPRCVAIRCPTRRISPSRASPPRARLEIRTRITLVAAAASPPSARPVATAPNTATMAMAQVPKVPPTIRARIPAIAAGVHRMRSPMAGIADLRRSSPALAYTTAKSTSSMPTPKIRKARYAVERPLKNRRPRNSSTAEAISTPAKMSRQSDDVARSRVASVNSPTAIPAATLPIQSPPTTVRTRGDARHHSHNHDATGLLETVSIGSNQLFTAPCSRVGVTDAQPRRRCSLTRSTTLPCRRYRLTARTLRPAIVVNAIHNPTFES